MHHGERKAYQNWRFRVDSKGRLTVWNPQGEKILSKAQCESYQGDEFLVQVSRPVFYQVQDTSFVIYPLESIEHSKDLTLTLSEKYKLQIEGKDSNQVTGITNAKEITLIGQKRRVSKRKLYKTNIEESDVKIVNPHGQKMSKSIEDLISSLASKPAALPTGTIDWTQIDPEHRPNKISQVGLLIELE